MDLDQDVTAPDENALNIEGQTPEFDASGNDEFQQAADQDHLFNNIGDAETSYKNLQSKFNERDSELREGRQYQDQVEQTFKNVGGPEAAANYLNMLTNDPGFRQWANNRQQELATGLPAGSAEDLSDAEKKGMETVQNMINQSIQNLKQQTIDPQINQQREASLDNAFERMDTIYPDWREHRESMEQMSTMFDPRIQENPKFEHVELLYKTARASNSDLMTSAQHNTDIQKRHMLSTGDSPTPAGEGMPIVGSIEEAFDYALKN